MAARGSQLVVTIPRVPLMYQFAYASTTHVFGPPDYLRTVYIAAPGAGKQLLIHTVTVGGFFPGSCTAYEFVAGGTTMFYSALPASAIYVPPIVYLFDLTFPENTAFSGAASGATLSGPVTVTYQVIDV